MSNARRTMLPSGLSERLLAIGFTVASVLLFSFLDGIAKYLGPIIPLFQIIWLRFVFHAVFTLVIFTPWRNIRRYAVRRPILTGLRALSLLGATVFNFHAIQTMQLAETISIMFAAPFLITAISGPLLGEWAGWRRWMAIIAGIVGVLFIAKPGFREIDTAILSSITAMMSYAAYALTTRILGPTETSESMLLTSAILPALLFTPLAVPAWQAPQSIEIWILLILAGALGAVGHWFMIEGYKRAPIPVLTPYLYSHIIWMVLLGFLVFGDIPDRWTVFGMAIIAASGLYILHRERLAERA